jgi:hypothetical protein
MRRRFADSGAVPMAEYLINAWMHLSQFGTCR